MPLSHASDRKRLSEAQCFLHEQIEFFVATVEDVNTCSSGRNIDVKVGQVGIRCAHCSMLLVKSRSKGSSYFPSTLSGIYQSAQNMHHCHFCAGCQKAESIKSKCNEVLASRPCHGGGKEYQSMAAEQMGLIETMIGLRFKNNQTKNNADKLCN